MGAWGHGPFDNDGALDYIGDLADGELGDMIDTLSCSMSMVVDAEGGIDRPEADDAVTAAALVAGRLGAAIVDPSAAELLASHPFDVDDELRLQALRTFERVSSPEDNEWYELWNDADAVAEVLAALRPYRDAVAAKLAA